MPEGLSAESAGCEALRASRPADGIRSVVEEAKRPRQHTGQWAAGAFPADPLHPVVIPPGLNDLNLEITRPKSITSHQFPEALLWLLYLPS